jgi:alpha-tubulin suppressor-like RCC1 family protein
MPSSRLRRAALTAVPTALALVAASSATAHATGFAVEGFGATTALGLATGTNAQHVTPTQIPEATAATAAAVGHLKSFVLTPGGVLATGAGNLGFGADYSEAPVFTAISGTAGAQGVATGDDATLILHGDGTVAAFGSDGSGADGHAPANSTTTTPTTVAGIEHATAVATGRTHSLALKSDGTVWAWGHAPYLGTSAASADTGTPIEVALPAGSVAIAIAAGGRHSLALLQDGSVWAWGANDAGQVGDGTTTDVVDPVRVIPPPAAGAPRVTAISAGEVSSFALYDDGSFRAWGDNGAGQLGLGNGGLSVNVPTAPDPAVVAAHPDHYPPLASISGQAVNTYAIARDDGRVYGWGINFDGELGFGDGPSTYAFDFPYTGASGSDPSQWATEIPQRIGRLKGASWLGAGSLGTVQIAAATPILTPLFSGPLPFFTQAVGTVSARKTATILSDGDPTTVTSVKVTGRDAADFEIVRYNATDDAADVGSLPLTVAADGYFGVYLRFYPSALGERDATLQVSGDGETASIPLSGFGIALPGNTPGADGGGGPAGPAGPAGASGAAGPPGAAGRSGKSGVVTFTAKKATTIVRRGRSATLSFTIKNGTAGRLVATTATATLPRALTAKGGKAIAVRALAAGAGRTVKVKVTAGRRAAPGSYTVKLRAPYGARAATVTAKVRVVR